MKRFVGYISMCASILTAVLVGVAPTILGVNGNSDFSTSKNYVFKISKRIINNDFSSGTQEEAVSQDPNKTPLEYVTETFKTRLDSAEISEYKLETIGEDKISLTFKDALRDYDDVIDYLTFSNSFLIKNYDESLTLGRNAEEVFNDSQTPVLFKNNSARVEYKDGYPYVVVDLDNPTKFKEIVTSVKESTGENAPSSSISPWRDPISKVGEVPGTEGDGEAEEVTKTDPKKVLFVLNNWLKGFDLSDILGNTVASVNENNFKDHVVTYFDVNKPESFFWNYDSSLSEEEQKEKEYSQVYFQFYDLGAINGGDTPLDVTTSYQLYNTKTADDRLAIKKASLLANKINGSSLPYQLTVINQSQIDTNDNIVPPFVEFIQQAGNINYASTVLISTAVAIVICTLFLLLNYGLSGLMGAITTLGNVVATLGVYNILGNEFNIGTILGLFAVTLISTFISSIWLHKAKNEVYAGKNLKKAYQEADKKFYSSLLDFSVIGAIVGLTCYLIPNAVLSSFGAVTLLGSAIGIVTNLIITRAANWFLYNSNFAQNHLKLFAIDTKVAADISKDVKSTYLESFKKSTPKGKFKITGIIASILLIGSICGITTYQVISGNIYNSATNEANTRVVVTYNVNNASSDYDMEAVAIKIENAIEDISTDIEKKNKAFKADTVTTNYYSYSYSYGATVDTLIKNKEYYFVIDLGKIVDTTSEEALYFTSSTATDEDKMSLKNAISQAIQIDAALGENYIINLERSYDVVDDFINLYVLIASSISLGVIALYFLLRFGPAKTLSGILIAGGTLTSVAGIFSLIRGPFPSEISLGLLILGILTYIILSVYYNGEKQFYKENRRKLESLEERETQFDYVNNLSYNFVLITTAIVAFMVMSFFFTDVFSVYTLALILLGMIIVCIFTKSLSLPLEMYLTKTFDKIKSRSGQNKDGKNKNKKVRNDDDGPQEAIFIGIND